MASGNLLNGGQRISGEPSEPGLRSSQCEDQGDTSGGSAQSGPVNRRGSIAPDLPRDLRVRDTEPNQGPDSKEKCSSVSCEPGAPCENADGHKLSEEELLNITFDACSTTVSGEVLASSIMKYLQAMTGQDPGQDRLRALQRLLDPEGRDPPVSRDTFHATMRDWISHCGQDGYYADDSPVSRADPSKVSINGMDFSAHEMKASLSEREPCYCESKDLLASVAELKQAYRRLSEQNSSLLRMVSQGEDTNLQLTVETTELCAKLASAQRSAARTRSLTEELQEARRVVRDAQERATYAQERAAQAQASCTRLNKEAECLKAHIKMLEDENEKLTLERTCSEDCVNKLRRVNAQMRAELAETLVMLSVRDREITKKDFLVDKMKNSHLENHKLIEGLQSELTRLQEHSQQALLRFDRHRSSQKGLLERTGIVSNNRSLHAEFQDIEQQRYGGLEEVTGLMCGDPSSHTDLQHIIHRIKSAELTHLLHHHYPDRDSAGYSVESLLHPYSRQHQASIKQQLTNVYELELHRALWEEDERKVAEQQRVLEPQQTQTQTQSQSQTQGPKQVPEARRAVLNWWSVLRGKTTDRPSQALSEIQANLLLAEQTIREMRVQICHLEADLKTAREGGVTGHEPPRNEVGVLHQDQQTSTEREGRPGKAGEEVKKERRDVGVSTDPAEEEPGGPAGRRVTPEGLLDSLRRMEAVVSAALETAQLLRDGQRRVVRVQERMDSIGQRVEEVLTRAADTDGQLSALEDRVTEDRVTAEPQSAGHRAADLGSAAAGSSAQAEPEGSGGDRPKSSSAPAPVAPDDSPPPQPLINVPTSSVWWEPGSSHGGRGSGQPSALETPGDDVCSGRDGSSSSQTVSCEDPGTPCPSENRTPPGLPSHPEPQQSDVTTGRGPPSLGFVPVSDANTSPSSALRSQLILRPTCAPPLIVLPETPPEIACDSSPAGSAGENVARSQSPTSSDRCQSEPAERGSGRASSPGDCGRSLPAQPQTGGRGLLSNPAEREKDQSPGSEHCWRSQTPETSSFASVEDAGQSAQSSPGRQASPHPEEEPPGPAPFIFPRTRSRPPLLPSMPTLPEEEEDSPEDVDSSSSSPSTCTPVVSRGVAMMTAPTIVFPKKVTVVQQDGRPLEQARPHSPRARLSRNIPSPITIVDSTGQVIDLVKDRLPELQLSEEDRQKNLELLDEAKKVSDRFLTRRGRRSTCSLSEPPTGLSPTPTRSSSPVPSRSPSLSATPQIVVGPSEVNYLNQPVSQRLEVPTVGENADVGTQEQETTRRLVDWKPSEKRKVSSGTLTPRHTGPSPPREPGGGQKENCDPRGLKKSPAPAAAHKPEEGPGRGPVQTPATGVAKPVPRPPTQQAPCTAEIKTIGAFPPLMRAVSWDMVGTLNALNGAPNFAPKTEEPLSFSDQPRDGLLKSSGYKDFPALPVNMHKLSKLREENKLIRNQSIVGTKLPDLSESAEQERGPSPLPSGSPADEEAKEKSDAMPNISDVMLRKLKLHRGLPGCAPPLTEKEVENAFVQLSLAFRNDNYTLETRLRQAERERNLTEENTEKELEEFKGSLKVTAPQWQNSEQRESYQRLLETVAVLHRLATRLSSRAEIVGAVRQEKRMNKATEVMMQYVENLKRTYEKDHAELMEFKKLANQNSNRCYSGSIDTGDDGVPRPSRSMSLTMGKALPRRRVSVAVVPKFNLLNLPGQTPATAGPGPSLFTGLGPGAYPAPTHGPGLPVLCEAGVLRASGPEHGQPAGAESGKTAVTEQEGEASAAAKPPVNLDDLRAQIRAEIKAKMEEEFYSKGYQEGLKQCKDLPEVKEEEEEKTEEKPTEPEEKNEEKGKQTKSSSKVAEALVVLYRVCPKIFRRNRLLWVILTLFLILFVVVNIFTYFSDRYNNNNNYGDMSTEKAIAQNKKIFGLNVGVQPKTPATE